MSIISVDGLPGKNSKNCPRSQQQSVLGMMGYKSFVYCNSGMPTDTQLNFLTNQLLVGRASIKVDYPAATGINKTDKDQCLYVDVCVESPCQVGTGANGQSLVITITDTSVNNTGVATPQRVESDEIPDNSIVLWSRAGGVYTDERCFQNELLEDKENCCEFEMGETLDVGDAVAYNPASGSLVRADANINNVRQKFAGIVKEINGTLAKVQVKGCVDTFDGDTLFPEDRSEAYLSNTQGFIIPDTHASFDPAFCVCIGVYACGKLILSPAASCLQDIQERLKVVENLQDPRCDIVVMQREISAFQGTFTFTNGHTIGGLPQCVSFQARIRDGNEFPTRTTPKISAQWCGSTGETVGCNLDLNLNIYNSNSNEAYGINTATPNIGQIGVITGVEGVAPVGPITITIGTPNVTAAAVQVPFTVAGGSFFNGTLYVVMKVN